MTQNLDTGSDLGFVTSATTPFGLIVGVTETYQEIAQSNIPERAQGIAAQIQALQPDLLALQEATTLRIGPFGGPATTVVADQLQSLTSALQARGLHYAAVAVQQNADVEALLSTNRFTSSTFASQTWTLCSRALISLSELQLENVQFQHYSATLVFPTVLGTSIPFPRGWIAVDAKLRGK
jgi:hypothetical protein